MDDVTRARRDRCSTFIDGDGLVRPAQWLRTIAPTTVADHYGVGGVVDDLEAYVSQLLGTEAALFLPSGTMAQGIALRIHADARTGRTVLVHPTSHLLLWEMDGPERLHHLALRTVGNQRSPLTLADLQGVAEPVAALLLELPAREIGGQLPTWDELTGQVAWARERGAAVHLDGARLWEASAGYGKSPAEIVALFDTAYVSFYKGIGALPGCCLVGSNTQMVQARDWRHRMGGRLFGMWPNAASALALLPERAAEMPARLAYAKELAEALAGVDGITVVPAVPQTPMMHLLFRTTPQRFARAAQRLAEEHHVWTWGHDGATADPEVVRVELSVGRGTCAVPIEQLVGHLTALMG